MIDSGWIVVSPFGIALLIEGGAPVALGVMASDDIALKIRKNLEKGFTDLRHCCNTLLASFNRLSRCKIATFTSFNPTMGCRRGEYRIVCVSLQTGGAGPLP
jgi:hypothetical protein